MNNNQNHERALAANCKGVFQASSYISFGTADKPLTYKKKEKDRSSFTGKQMSTNPMKMGQLPEIYFDKKYSWISDSDKYFVQRKYSELQKEKKKGFGTGDFRRRDEFANVIRTEQYRQQLGSEVKYSKVGQSYHTDLQDKIIAGEDFQNEALAKTSTRAFNEKPFLYDLVYEKDDGKSTSKLARDTKNPTVLSTERQFGMQTRSSAAVGQRIWTKSHGKPDHARCPIIKSTFFRPSKVPFACLDVAGN